MTTKPPCEDSDPQCSICHGHCQHEGTIILYRIDMEDQTGTLFCEQCADDASESGLFTDLVEEDETE